MLLLPLLCTAVRSADTSSPLPKRPNIVFIFSDDHSLQSIGAYGSHLSEFCRQHNVTPNLDRLAAAGALFPNSFCGNSLCSPSRASILTGLHSRANGVMNLNSPVRSGLWMFPQAVRTAGYQTAAIGKWHLGDTPAQTDYSRLLRGQGDYWNPEFIGPEGVEKRTGYVTDIITDMGIDWLKQRDGGKPFLLMLQHKAPHRPWAPPTRYYQWLADVTIPEPPTLFDDYKGRAEPARTQRMEVGRDMNLLSDLKVVPPGKGPNAEFDEAFGPRNEAFEKANLQGTALTRWKYQEYMKDYLRCVKGVDDSIGRVLDYLKAEGLEDNTVVIYSSDQGFFNGEHGWFDKRWIYEESIHMPLIVRWPGVVKPGSRPTPMVQNIDYAPTFVEIAGGTVPPGLHGKSIVPILRGETPADWRTNVYYHYYDRGHAVTPHYGVRTSRFTLAHFYSLDQWELFDNEKDPHQLRSVYDDPAYGGTVAQLKTELERLRKDYEADFDPQVADAPRQAESKKPSKQKAKNQ